MATVEEDEQSLNDSFVDEPSGEDSNDSIANILKRLPTGAVIKRTEQNYHCHKCKIQFSNREELLTHITKHVSMPLLILDKIDDDCAEQEDEDDDDWSEDDLDDIDIDTKPIKIISKEASSTFNKILNSNIIIKKTGFTPVAAALSEHPNLSIKKLPSKDNSTDKEENNSRGSIKITIKHDAKENNFHVVNESSKETEKSSPKLPTEPPEMVDSKEGILESVKIKNEPIDNSQVQNDVLQPRIKREIPSPTNSDALYKEMQERNKAEQNRSKQQATVSENAIIPKKEPEEQSCTIIEINGDDSDNDDDLIFVSSSPPPDKKPKITELSPAPLNTTNQKTFTPISTVQNTPVTNTSVSNSSNKNTDWSNLENFDAMLSDKSADAILKSLLDEHNRKEAVGNDYGTSEYISLDKLGPQYSCDVCNAKFTYSHLLDDHRKATGHSKEIVLSMPTSSSLVPSYNKPDMGLMNSFFPVKQIAETVGKLTSVNPSNAFTHQQNIMVNIQSFPGGMNQPYTPDPHSAAAMHSSYPPGYRMPGPPPYNSQYMNTPQPYPNSYTYPGGIQQPRDYQTNAPYLPGYPQHMPQQPPPGHPPNHYLTNPQAPLPNNMNSPYSNYPPATVMSDSSQNSQPQMMMSGGNFRLPNVSSAQMNFQPAASVPSSIHSSASSVPTSPMSAPLTSNVKIATSVQPTRPQIRPSVRGRGRGVVRPGMRPTISPGAQVQNQIKRIAGSVLRPAFKQNITNGGGSPVKKRLEMLMPSRHDSDDCEAVSIQHQKEGPMIQNIQGSEKPVQLNSQITVTKKKVRPPTPPPPVKDANTVASMLARRGIKITQKAKSPSPPPINIPNLGSGIVITHTKSSSSDDSKDIFTQRSLKCDTCPVSYPTAAQLQEHKRLFHSASASDLGLPVVDLSQQANIRKLSSLGINNFIPLANREQGGGCFGIPIVSVQNVMSGTVVNSLHALGSNGILSLGPVKPLPKC